MKFPHDVRGWLSEAEGRKLAELAEGRHVLELGSYEGRSTICMAQTAAVVVAVDHHKGDAHTGPADTLQAFVANLDRYGVRSKVHVFPTTIEEADALLKPGKFDLVLIDSAHDEESVARDLKLALKCLKPGGTLAIHDWPEEGVKRAVRKAFPRADGREVDRLCLVENAVPAGDPLRVLVGMPRYTQDACIEAARAFFLPHAPESSIEVRCVSYSSSLLTGCFNQLWAIARNEYEEGAIDAFAMIHADVGAEIHWLDLLRREMDAAGADVIAAVVPIKDDRGLTSTAVDDTGDPWRVRRLTLKQCAEFPTTFGDEEAGGPLLLNTGLWLAKLGPWCRQVHFRQQDLIRREADGRWHPRVIPEDWDFSRQLRAQGLKLAATKAVAVNHYGQYRFRSGDVWGKDADDTYGIQAAEATAGAAA